MLLLIRRDPRIGTPDKLKYVLSVRAELSKKETALVRVNKLDLSLIHISEPTRPY